MDGNFSACFAFVLGQEGGFSNHPHDAGGPTFRGVTLQVFRDAFGAEKTADDLGKLTLAQIETIYRSRYWDLCGGDQLPQGLDLVVFDFAVNSGPGRAVRFLQRILDVKQDGDVGPITLAAAAACVVPVVVHQICSDRLIFVQGLWNWIDFGRGWSRRILETQFTGLRMCRQLFVA